MPKKRQPRLYSYVLRYDDGAAPNPFYGICTLVICKPRIRLGAQEGDWVVGTGSAHSPLGDKRGWLVYAMKLTQPKLTLAKYDKWAKKHCRGKLPDPANSDIDRRCGDAIYDFSGRKPKQRWSVHGQGEKKTDLSGRYALLSKQFFYFGSQPIELPKKLKKICHPTSGERWRPNEALKDDFVTWLESLGKPVNKVFAAPARPPLRQKRLRGNCSDNRPCTTSCVQPKNPPRQNPRC